MKNKVYYIKDAMERQDAQRKKGVILPGPKHQLCSGHATENQHTRFDVRVQRLLHPK